MKDHSHLSETKLNFNEIVKVTNQDNRLLGSLSSLRSKEDSEIATETKSLKFSNDRNIFHLGKNYPNGIFINTLLENKEEEIINMLHKKDFLGFNPLHLAIMRGENATISDFLKKDPTLVFEKDEHGNSPLHLALMKNADISILDKLFNSIIKSSDKSNLQESFQLISQYLNPTEHSVKNVMNSLLKKDVDINAINNDGNTALHLAALNGNLEMMNFLLNHGAKFDIKDRNGKNPLELITDENHQKKLFSQAVEGNNLELVKTLFEMDFKYDETDYLLKNAVKSNNLELLSFMVKDIGIDPYEHDRISRSSGRRNINIENPLDTAIYRALHPDLCRPRDESNEDFLSKQEAIIKLLLENGALPNKDSVNRDRYPNDLDKLTPNLKAHIAKYDNVSIMFNMPQNVTKIEKIIDSFLRDGVDLEKTQPITLLYYSKETSASGETKLIIAECEPIELTALGIVNLNRHSSFSGFKSSNANDDKIEELHKKIIESRSKSIKVKLSDSAEIAPSSSIGSSGVEAVQPSTKKARSNA